MDLPAEEKAAAIQCGTIWATNNMRDIWFQDEPNVFLPLITDCKARKPRPGASNSITGLVPGNMMKIHDDCKTMLAMIPDRPDTAFSNLVYIMAASRQITERLIHSRLDDEAAAS